VNCTHAAGQVVGDGQRAHVIIDFSPTASGNSCRAGAFAAAVMAQAPTIEYTKTNYGGDGQKN